MPLQIPNILQPQSPIVDGIPVPWVASANNILRMFSPRVVDLLRAAVEEKEKEKWDQKQLWNSTNFPDIVPDTRVRPVQLGTLPPDPGLIEKAWERIPDPARQGLVGLSGLLGIPAQVTSGLATVGGRNLADLLSGKLGILEQSERSKALRKQGLLSGGYNAYDTESVPFGTGLAGFLTDPTNLLPFGGVARRVPKVAKEAPQIVDKLSNLVLEAERVPRPGGSQLNTVLEQAGNVGQPKLPDFLRRSFGENEVRAIAENLPDSVKPQAFDTLERAKKGLLEGRISQESYNRLLKGLPDRWNTEAARLAESPISEPMVGGFESPLAKTVQNIKAKSPAISTFADQIPKNLPDRDNIILRAYDEANNVFRTLITGTMDVGYGLAQTPELLFGHPVKFATILTKSFINIADPTGLLEAKVFGHALPKVVNENLQRLADSGVLYKKFLENNKPFYEWAAKYDRPLPRTEGVSDLSGSLLERIPVIGAWPKALNRGMGAFLEMFRTEMDKARVGAYFDDAGKFVVSNPLKLSDNDIRKIFQESAAQFVATHGPIAQAAKRIVFAPHFTEAKLYKMAYALTMYSPEFAAAGGPVKFLPRLLFTGPGGDIRRNLAAMTTAMTMWMVVNNTLKGYPTEWDITKPNGWRVRNVGGTDIPVFLSYQPETKAVAQIAGRKPLEAATEYAGNRAAVPIGIAIDLGTGYNRFTGRGVGGFNSENWNTPEKAAQNIQNILLGMAPMPTQPLMEPQRYPGSQAAAVAMGIAGIPGSGQSFTDVREDWLQSNRARLLQETTPNMLKMDDGVTDAKSWDDLTPQDQAFLSRTPELQQLRKTFETDKERDIASGKLTPTVSQSYYLTRESNYQKKLDISKDVEEGKISLKDAREKFRELNTQTGVLYGELQKTSEHQKRMAELKAASKVPPEYGEALSKYHEFGKDYDARDEWLASLPDKVQTYVESNVGTTLVPLEKRISSMYRIVKPYKDVDKIITTDPLKIVSKEFMAEFPTSKLWKDLKERYDAAEGSVRERDAIADIEVEIDGEKVKPWSEYRKAVALAKLKARVDIPIGKALEVVGSSSEKIPVREEYDNVKVELADAIKRRLAGEKGVDVASPKKRLAELEWALGLRSSPFLPEEPKKSTSSTKSGEKSAMSNMLQPITLPNVPFYK